MDCGIHPTYQLIDFDIVQPYSYIPVHRHSRHLVKKCPLFRLSVGTFHPVSSALPTWGKMYYAQALSKRDSLTKSLNFRFFIMYMKSAQQEVVLDA